MGEFHYDNFKDRGKTVVVRYRNKSLEPITPTMAEVDGMQIGFPELYQRIADKVLGTFDATIESDECGDNGTLRACSVPQICRSEQAGCTPGEMSALEALLGTTFFVQKIMGPDGGNIDDVSIAIAGDSNAFPQYDATFSQATFGVTPGETTALAGRFRIFYGV